ncbi:MAG: PhoH family protein, partial [Bacteroidota bacterium]|nr:PhoH family protein [Bacteroidota bacterium]
NAIKVIGNTEDILLFQQKFDAILKHVNQYDSLTISQLERLVLEDDNSILSEENALILHGQKGRIIKARTLNQREMVKQSEENDMLFAIGPAGTGKTYTAVALAVRALKQKQVKRIILTRPAVEAGENLGFLPGDLKEKLDPYLQPLYDALLDMLPSEKLVDYSEQGIIQIAPLAFMRGRTLDNAFVILDEAQNATESQIKMFLTRMGKSAKFIITGDVTQIDLPKNQPSGLLLAQKILPKTEGISFVTLDERDVIRHQLVKKIIKAFNKLKKAKK